MLVFMCVHFWPFITVKLMLLDSMDILTASSHLLPTITLFATIQVFFRLKMIRNDEISLTRGLKNNPLNTDRKTDIYKLSCEPGKKVPTVLYLGNLF